VISITEFCDQLITNIETVIIGKRSQIEFLVIALLCEGHVLLEDVPGTGKTTLARATAASLGVGFKRLQCTPDLLPSDITGVSVYNQQNNLFEFRPGPVFTNILLADEINRATPRSQSALLEAMQERQVTLDGTTHPLPLPFLVLATQNPVEYEGTFPLPEAQLDRFLIRLALGYPDGDQELQIPREQRQRHPLETIQQVVAGTELPQLHQLISDIYIEQTLERYILTLVQATRSHPDVALGASPRGTLALYKTSQALAALHNRAYVIPDDIKLMAPLTLGHRLILRPESQLRGVTASKVLTEILERAPLDLGESASSRSAA
jgi:MoxR-like ATPase